MKKISIVLIVVVFSFCMFYLYKTKIMDKNLNGYEVKQEEISQEPTENQKDTVKDTSSFKDNNSIIERDETPKKEEIKEKGEEKDKDNKNEIVKREPNNSHNNNKPDNKPIVSNKNPNNVDNKKPNESVKQEDTNHNDKPEKTIWEKLGMTEHQYYNEPLYKWERIDFKTMNECTTYGDKYEPYINGEVLYNCREVTSASGKLLGIMFDTEKLN